MNKGWFSENRETRIPQLNWGGGKPRGLIEPTIAVIFLWIPSNDRADQLANEATWQEAVEHMLNPWYIQSSHRQVRLQAIGIDLPIPHIVMQGVVPDHLCSWTSLVEIWVETLIVVWLSPIGHINLALTYVFIVDSGVNWGLSVEVEWWCLIGMLIFL